MGVPFDFGTDNLATAISAGAAGATAAFNAFIDELNKGQQAVVPDLHEAFGQDVLQETAQKLDGVECDDTAEDSRPSATVHHGALSASAWRSLAALAEPAGSAGVAGAPAACRGGPPMRTTIDSTRPAVEVAEVIREYRGLYLVYLPDELGAQA
jgi:hypothetical protein